VRQIDYEHRRRVKRMPFYINLVRDCSGGVDYLRVFVVHYVDGCDRHLHASSHRPPGALLSSQVLPPNEEWSFMFPELVRVDGESC